MEEQVSQQSIYQQQPTNQQISGISNQEEPKEWLAIASFVLSLVGFNILWLIFGIIALKKKQLRWAALAWTIISAVKLVLSVFVVMWILAGALIPRIWAAKNKADDVARKQNVRQLVTAMVSYGIQNDVYPESCYSGTEWLLDGHWVDASFDWQPAVYDEYKYTRLDEWNHFVFFVKLSEWSDLWNCNYSDFAWICSNKMFSTETECEANSMIRNDSNITNYDEAREKIIGSGDTFCYLY